ncbi:TIR domain-containing protein [Oscillochloris sp. ZM17-4]|uniref:TIR domain-containing protein n=1 Tax=Oscillochloris sp. ZM17-4 TaxID=2866714 RepID=UPI001C729E44|nr:TIR domain-containing protein [Oscillochloris sp. ZM17-4]MBX0327773.1 TIR domain-containing protein [Oscillochloris sp. ZM17-4]
MGEHLFISYAQRDRAYVLALVGWMREAGMTPWWFEEDESHTGGMFAEMLMPAIAEARAVIVVLSRSSVGSRAVAQEVIFAGERRKLIITLLLEECAGPVRFLLGPDNWVNLRQVGNPVPRIAAALDSAGPPLPLAYLAAAEGHEALVAPSFIALEAARYQRQDAGPAQAEHTLASIGTLPSNHMVVIARGGLISRSHAHISLRVAGDGAPTFLLYDTSKNGTFVNGRRIAEPRSLDHGDVIGLAGEAVMLQFLRHGETATAEGGITYGE